MTEWRYIDWYSHWESQGRTVWDGDTRYWLQINDRDFARLYEYGQEFARRRSPSNSQPWTFEFAVGLQGLFRRLTAFHQHFWDLHAWRLTAYERAFEPDQHVSVCLFGMDSSIECLTYALNALGFAAEPELFVDITDPKLRARIGPNDVVGASAFFSRNALPGYAKYFPSLQQHWQKNVELMRMLMDHHDASKHRQSTVAGGAVRRDAPEAVRQRFGSTGLGLMSASPMEVTSLNPHPKPNTPVMKPPDGRNVTLEDLARRFLEFIHETGARVWADVQATIPEPSTTPK